MEGEKVEELGDCYGFRRSGSCYIAHFEGMKYTFKRGIQFLFPVAFFL